MPLNDAVSFRRKSFQVRIGAGDRFFSKSSSISTAIQLDRQAILGAIMLDSI
jgi:hypothetical protein